MSAILFLEGGGPGDLDRRCREGFRELLKACGFSNLPRLVACGGRNATYDRFCTGHRSKANGDYIAMLVDSEEPVADAAAPWLHLSIRDGWTRPEGATDEQVLLMVTCMETWIVCDRERLAQHYGADLQEGALPALVDLEGRTRDGIQDQLSHAIAELHERISEGQAGIRDPRDPQSRHARTTSAELRPGAKHLDARAWLVTDLATMSRFAGSSLTRFALTCAPGAS